MDDRIGPEVAETFLQDVTPPWRRFWFHMHAVAKNLDEFAEGLTVISDEVFAYHMSGQKNDFSRWIREVIGDDVLARELEKVKTKAEAAAIVGTRVSALRKTFEEG